MSLSWGTMPNTYNGTTVRNACYIVSIVSELYRIFLAILRRENAMTNMNHKSESSIVPARINDFNHLNFGHGRTKRTQSI